MALTARYDERERPKRAHDLIAARQSPRGAFLEFQNRTLSSDNTARGSFEKKREALEKDDVRTAGDAVWTLLRSHRARQLATLPDMTKRLTWQELS